MTLYSSNDLTPQRVEIINVYRNTPLICRLPCFEVYNLSEAVFSHDVPSDNSQPQHDSYQAHLGSPSGHLPDFIPLLLLSALLLP